MDTQCYPIGEPIQIRITHDGWSTIKGNVKLYMKLRSDGEIVMQTLNVDIHPGNSVDAAYFILDYKSGEITQIYSSIYGTTPGVDCASFQVVQADYDPGSTPQQENLGWDINQSVDLNTHDIDLSIHYFSECR